MTSRVARLDVAGLRETDRGSTSGVVDSPASENSLLGILRQRFSADEELAEQLQSGNSDALTVLFNRYSALLFGIAKRILRDEAEAEDAVQQIFLDVYRSIQQFDREKGSFKTWLLMFAYHRTFNSRRSQTAKRLCDSYSLEDGIAHDGHSQQGPRVSPENNVLVEQFLKSLQPRQRRTIELIYYEGLTAEEVSTHTGESVRVVRHNLYRGLDKMRTLLLGDKQPRSRQKGRLL
jgi:RNA polymerase sigma-70 factor (ECF subfamily)